MKNQKGFSIILIVVGVLIIVSATLGLITIYKDKITASVSDIFKGLHTEDEQIDAEDLVFELQELQSEPEALSRQSTTQSDATSKAELCKVEAGQNTQQHLKEYEEQLKADWPNYLGATYDDLMEIYSDPSSNKYVQNPEIRISMVETAINSAQQTIQKKLSETESVVYPQCLQECLNK